MILMQSIQNILYFLPTIPFLMHFKTAHLPQPLIDPLSLPRPILGLELLLHILDPHIHNPAIPLIPNNLPLGQIHLHNFLICFLSKKLSTNSLVQ